jgi:hypothetical protein
MKEPWGPFADLRVERDVLAVVGGREALLAQLAGAESTVRCDSCGQVAAIATTALSLIAQTTTGDPRAPGFVRLSFAHQRCLPSVAMVDEAIGRGYVAADRPDDEIRVARALRSAAPIPAVIWEPAGRNLFESTAGGEPRDLFVSGLLQQGWTLLDGDPQTATLPVVPGWRLIAERHQITLYDRDGNQPLKAVTVPPLPGWLQAYEAARHRVALIAGTGIGLDTGEPGLLAAIRGGRVAGATVATHPIDEREYVHVFIVRWRTKGKVARFVIDGRRYRHPDAVLADMKEAAHELSRRHLPAEIETSPIGPTQHGPLLPSWPEFREQLMSDQDFPP